MLHIMNERQVLGQLNVRNHDSVSILLILLIVCISLSSCVLVKGGMNAMYHDGKSVKLARTLLVVDSVIDYSKMIVILTDVKGKQYQVNTDSTGNFSCRMDSQIRMYKFLLNGSELFLIDDLLHPCTSRPEGRIILKPEDTDLPCSVVRLRVRK